MLNFEMLRQIAECASGMRNENLWFVVTGNKFTVEKKEPFPVDPEAIVIPVEKVNDPPSKVTAAWISDATGPEVNLMEVKVPAIGPYPAGIYAADAVFWSVSAVEKFLVPYYASVYGDTAWEHVKTVMSILMPPPDQDFVIDPQPYAIAHLPSSEYTGVPDSGSTTGSESAAHAGRREFFDNMFVLRGGHAEPLTRHWRKYAAQSGSAEDQSDSAEAQSGGVEAQSDGESPRTNGSRRRYARIAGR